MINLAILPYAAPPIIASTLTLALAILAISNDHRDRTNQFFALFMIATTVWLSGFGFMNMMSSENIAFVWTRILYTGVILIPVFYYSFILSFLGTRSKRALIAMWSASTIFISLLWMTRNLMAGNILYSWGYSGKAGPIHALFVLYLFITFLLSFRKLHHAYRNSKIHNPAFANRIKYLLVACAVALFGSYDFLSTYGFNSYPIGFIFVSIFGIITLWAILKHRLMDLNIVLKKGFLHSLSSALLSFVVVFLVLLSNWLSQIYFNQPKSIIFLLIMSVILGFLLVPLHALLSNFLSRLIYKSSVQDLAEQNFQMKKELRNHDRLRSVAILAAGMAHEIKNPLTSIRTFAEYLPAKYDQPEFREKFSRLVVDEVDRVNSIIQQLLDFSKPKALEIERFELDKLISETLDLLGSNLVQNKIEVIKDVQVGIWIAADRRQLKQVFVNLFLNAIQAMSSGGALTIKTHQRDDGAEISIEDTGPGIPKDHLSHIFDPFFTTKDSGTGSGLAVVHGIIERHGGKIKAENSEEGGAKVSVFLKS